MSCAFLPLFYGLQASLTQTLWRVAQVQGAAASHQAGVARVLLMPASRLLAAPVVRCAAGGRSSAASCPLLPLACLTIPWHVSSPSDRSAGMSSASTPSASISLRASSASCGGGMAGRRQAERGRKGHCRRVWGEQHLAGLPCRPGQAAMAGRWHGPWLGHPARSRDSPQAWAASSPGRRLMRTGAEHGRGGRACRAGRAAAPAAPWEGTQWPPPWHPPWPAEATRRALCPSRRPSPAPPARPGEHWKRVCACARARAKRRRHKRHMPIPKPHGSARRFDNRSALHSASLAGRASGRQAGRHGVQGGQGAL